MLKKHCKRLQKKKWLYLLKALFEANKAHSEISSYLNIEVPVLPPGVSPLVNITADKALQE
jgi:hypothetical protein